MVTGDITGRHESNCAKPGRNIREIFYKKAHPEIKRFGPDRFWEASPQELQAANTEHPPKPKFSKWPPQDVD